MTSWKTTPVEKFEVAVIGGGAAGMTAAIAAAKAGARVILLERNDRLGKKILMTGNGKCNLGNTDLKQTDYYSDNMAMVASVLERFGAEDTIAFFSSLGLCIKEKNGYLYPLSEQASVVLDVLRYGLERYGVSILTDAMVQCLQQMESEVYYLILQDGRRIQADRVILTCGGQASPKTGSDGNGYTLARGLGHRIISPLPSLVQLHCSEKYCKALAGVRAEGTVRIYMGKKELVCEEKGEIQLTEYGISGIPVFQLSGKVNQLLAQGKKLMAELDFFPQYESDVFEKFCRERLKYMKSATVEVFFTGMLHKKLMQVCIRLAGLNPQQRVSDADPQKVKQVFILCRRLPFTITGSHSFESAQVSRGGVSLLDVDTDLQSIHHKGLYLAGEILHVDGRCGGYNLHWAWASGTIAGNTAAESLQQKQRR